jgi:hypothetical protein
MNVTVVIDSALPFWKMLAFVFHLNISEILLYLKLALSARCTSLLMSAVEMMVYSEMD